MSLRPGDLWDRAATLVVGLAVAAIGVAAVLWPTRLVRGVPEHLSAGPVLRATASSWWPWELAGAGVLLVLIGLLWLISHIPTRKTPVLRVPGTTDPGFITINLDGVASAAATALEQEPDVQSAKGKAITDRGTPTVELTVTVVHPAGLTGALTAIGTTYGHIARATTSTGTPPVAARTMLQIAKPGGASRNLRKLE